MAELILGRRFSLSPVLGVVRLAFASDEERRKVQGGERVGPRWARRNAGATPPPPPPAEERPVPLAPEAPPADSGSAKAKREPSTVYTRATHGKSKRGLSDDEKATVDAYVAEHQKSGRTRHISPLAAAVETDLPALSIAHYLESHHGIPTIPEHPEQQGHFDKVRLEGGGEQWDFPGWADQYARRLREHDAGVHFPPEDEAEDEAQRKRAIAEHAVGISRQQAGLARQNAEDRSRIEQQELREKARAGRLSLVLGRRFSLGPVLGVRRRFGFADDEQRGELEKSPHVGFHGMIDPRGQLHPVSPDTTHEDWSREHLFKKGVEPGEDETHLGHLLKRGWVRVNNRGFSPAAHVRTLRHQGGKEALLEHLMHQDPNQRVTVQVDDDPDFDPRTAGEAVRHLLEHEPRHQYSNAAGGDVPMDEVAVVCQKLLGWS